MSTSERVLEQDGVTVEIFANLFRAVVDEMAWVVLRSAHTTFVKETQDFATGLITPEGEMFSSPLNGGASVSTLVPMHAGTHAREQWRPGDVLLTNDPYSTGGMVTHLNDIFVFRPIFAGEELVCFAWAFIHFTDVGGAAPGSIDMQNRELYQEGLRIRPRLLFRQGVFDDGLWTMLADNSRIPDLNWGDMSALLSSLEIADRRVRHLVETHGLEQVRASMYGALAQTEAVTRSVLAEIPAGSYRFTEYFEDDYATDLPVRLEVCLTSDGVGGVELDYTGSDPQVQSALNVPLGGQERHAFGSVALINFVLTRAESIHFNSGVLRPISLVLPDSSVVNASFPAAAGMRIITVNRMHDMVLGALAQALPGSVPAGGSGQMVITYLSTSQVGGGGRVVVANPVQGGSGGGPELDGVSGVSYGTGAGMRNVPVEVLEAEAPVLVHRFGLRPDSEGPGRLRSGFGLDYTIEVTDPTAVVVMRGKDRHRFSGWGVDGGGAGTTASNLGDRPDGSQVDVGKQTVYTPAREERLHIRTGGGGGFGNPFARDPAAVLRDVRDGVVSVARARDVYGVEISAAAVDGT
ncbi:MAG: hydantoinase B/oxoprolinase family protein, partial [Candidatus Dormiibacterota bacterium]